MPDLLITGDVLRTNLTGKPDQWSNTGWLRRLLSPALQIATNNCPVREVSWVKEMTEFDGTMVYAAHGLEASTSSWAKLFAATPNALALAYLEEFFSGSFVVGFELSPYLQYALIELGVTYIDLCIHPVRYMEDLLLYACSNSKIVTERLESYALTEADFRLRSSFLAAAWRREGYIQPRKHTAVMLCFQTPYDRVVINDGRFVSVADYISEIHALRASVDRFYIKPHPYETSKLSENIIIDQVQDVEIIDRNFYEIIARGDVDSVLSLSSSTSIEAAYLGLEGRQLFRNYYDYAPNLAGGGKFTPLLNDFLWPDFWRSVLEPHMGVTKMGGYRSSSGEGILRRSLGQAWDFSKWR